MSFWKIDNKNTRFLDNVGLSLKQGNASKAEFYELEMGIVLDIVLDETHPIFTQSSKSNVKIDSDRWPSDLSNLPALPSDNDLTWIGRVLVRPIYSEPLTDKDQLVWAFPLDKNISEYPLINETVILTKQGEQLYYTKKINYHNWTNNNLDFGLSTSISGKKNTNLFSNDPLTGVISITKQGGGTNYQGIAGKYFSANNKIRTIKRFEGDLLIESRFGQTIHFSAYDKNRGNDAGDPKNTDYKDGGNPMILIRNRQRPLVKEGQVLVPHKKLPPIIGTSQEKNTGGYLEENINHDGSSIHITSGQTISQYFTTCYKKMFGTGEEVSQFNGASQYKYPILNNDQIIINSDRLILSSRYGETFHYSKKKYGIVTDSEFTVDAHQQIVLTTNTKTIINSPAIYLGEYDNSQEPALLGQTTINLLYQVITWMMTHNHWYHHSHTNAGKESPSATQIPVEAEELLAIRDNLQSLLSRRVFITGGGFAPGQNGGSITDGSDPLKINIGDGSGVPGGWNASNFRKN